MAVFAGITRRFRMSEGLATFFARKGLMTIRHFFPYATTDEADLLIEHSLTAGSNIQREREVKTISKKM